MKGFLHIFLTICVFLSKSRFSIDNLVVFQTKTSLSIWQEHNNHILFRFALLPM